MIDLNTSLHAPVANVPATSKTVQEQVVTKQQQVNGQTSAELSSGPYQGVIINKNNKDVIVKIGGMKLQDYSQEAKTAVNDIRTRAGEKGQF